MPGQAGQGAGVSNQQHQQQQQRQPSTIAPRGRVGFCMWIVGPLIYVWGGYEVRRRPELQNYLDEVLLVQQQQQHQLHQNHDSDTDNDSDDDSDHENDDEFVIGNLPNFHQQQLPVQQQQQQQQPQFPPAIIVDELDAQLVDFVDEDVNFADGGVVVNQPDPHILADLWGADQLPQARNVYYRQSTWVPGDQLLCYCTDSRTWLKTSLQVRSLGFGSHQHRNFMSGFSGSACCTNADESRLYISGGFNESVHQTLSATNAVYAIHVNQNRLANKASGYQVSCQFSMETRGPQCQKVPMPRDKHSAIYWRNSLIIFGGYCLNPPTTLMNSVDYCGSSMSFQDVFFRPECFQPNDSLRFAWSNELLQLDLATGNWSQLDAEGAAPTPRAAHSMIRVKSRALLFGGRVLDRRTNDLFCLCLESMQWTKLQPQGTLPEPRSWTTFVQVGPRHVFCFGGYPWAQPPAVLKPFNNCFLYDLANNQFRQLKLPDRPGLLWHGSCAQLDNRSAFIWGGCMEDIMMPAYRRDFNSSVLEFPRLLVPSLASMCSDLVVQSPEIYPLTVLNMNRPITNAMIQRRLLMSGPLLGG